MDFVIQNWYLIAIAVISGILLLFYSGMGFSKSGTDVPNVIRLINHERAVIVDLRSSEQFTMGHIAKSKNISLQKLEVELPPSAKNKKYPVIFVCSNGRSAHKAMSIAKRLGYEAPHVLSGGLHAWINSDMPLDNKKE